jgi:tetratricopeptide (TPR) repeat protein
MLPPLLHERVKKLVEAAECADDIEMAASHYRNAIDLLEAVPEGELSSELAYVLGYAWYNLPKGAPEQSTKVERALRLAIQRDPSNSYASLYLGHHLFDAGRYSEALEHFRSISPFYFRLRGQQWRDVKLEELKACCALKVGEVEEAVEGLQSFFDAWRHAPEEDRPAMTELRETLKALLHRPKEKSVARR